MNIGQAIKILRKSKKIKQFHLANTCGISQTSLSQIESGAKYPHQSTLRAICKGLDVPEILLYVIASDEIPHAKKEIIKLILKI